MTPHTTHHSAQCTKRKMSHDERVKNTTHLTLGMEKNEDYERASRDIERKQKPVTSGLKISKETHVACSNAKIEGRCFGDCRAFETSLE